MASRIDLIKDSESNGNKGKKEQPLDLSFKSTVDLLPRLDLGSSSDKSFDRMASSSDFQSSSTFSTPSNFSSLFGAAPSPLNPAAMSAFSNWPTPGSFNVPNFDPLMMYSLALYPYINSLGLNQTVNPSLASYVQYLKNMCDFVSRKNLLESLVTSNAPTDTSNLSQSAPSFSQAPGVPPSSTSISSHLTASSDCQTFKSSSNSDSSHFRSSLGAQGSTKITDFQCSCGDYFPSLSTLGRHAQTSHHSPISELCRDRRSHQLSDETSPPNPDYPKLVRGQDMWLSNGAEKTAQILRCIKCSASFSSMTELTMHMIETQHFTNIVGAVSSAVSRNSAGEASPPFKVSYMKNNFVNSSFENEGKSRRNQTVLYCGDCNAEFHSMDCLSKHLVLTDHQLPRLSRRKCKRKYSDFGVHWTSSSSVDDKSTGHSASKLSKYTTKELADITAPSSPDSHLTNYKDVMSEGENLSKHDRSRSSSCSVSLDKEPLLNKSHNSDSETEDASVVSEKINRSAGRSQFEDGGGVFKEEEEVDDGGERIAGYKEEVKSECKEELLNDSSEDGQVIRERTDSFVHSSSAFSTSENKTFGMSDLSNDPLQNLSSLVRGQIQSVTSPNEIISSIPQNDVSASSEKSADYFGSLFSQTLCPLSGSTSSSNGKVSSSLHSPLKSLEKLVSESSLFNEKSLKSSRSARTLVFPPLESPQGESSVYSLSSHLLKSIPGSSESGNPFQFLNRPSSKSSLGSVASNRGVTLASLLSRKQCPKVNRVRLRCACGFAFISNEAFDYHRRNCDEARISKNGAPGSHSSTTSNEELSPSPASPSTDVPIPKSEDKFARYRSLAQELISEKSKQLKNKH